MTAAELLAKHGINLPSTAPGRHYTTCPQCSAGRASKEHRAAKVLGVTIEADGKVRWGCNHCDFTGPEKGSGDRSNGKEWKDLPAYVYRDADGAPRFRKVRNLPGREPRFWLERANGRGGWVKGTEGVDTKIIYRADEVKKAIAEGRIIACAEGEKDADNLWGIGIAATCNAHGASEPGKRAKWTKTHSEQLAGADIVVLNDNDAAGYEHADATAKLSLGIARRVRRLDLAKHWPEIPKGGDVSDWLAAGHGGDELRELIEAAPDYASPPPPPPEPKPEAESATDAEIARLAKLALVDYEHERKKAAERLNVRASILDRLVEAERERLGLTGDDSRSGHVIEFSEPEPWPEPVNGAELFDAIAKAIGLHVIMPEHSRDAAALWVAHTYLLDCFMISPRLGITSPTKGCGKTTFLDTVACLVLRPLPAANISPSAVFRVIEACRPTTLVDEADSFIKDNEELRGVLNSGHRRGGSVLRTVAVGDDFEVRSFSTYGACAIALIGQLPGTLADRSVPITLTRRKRDEAITSFRLDRIGHLVTLARKLARWTKDNEETIATAEPEMPSGLYNRAADNWRPLLAIATVAGGDWLARGHTAALAGASADVDELSRLELLLGDVRDVFDGLLSDVDRISSAHLIDKLVVIVPRPWGEYGKAGKPITQNKLARLLQPLHISAQVIRIGVETPRGYYRKQFEEAWERFLSPEGGFKAQQRNKADEIRTSGAFQSATAKSDVAVSKCEKSNNDGLCCGVAVGKGGKGNGSASSPSADGVGISAWHIHQLSDEYQDRAYANSQETGGDTRTAECDAWLRQKLADEGVLPESIEVEFQRVMAQVFRV